MKIYAVSTPAVAGLHDMFVQSIRGVEPDAEVIVKVLDDSGNGDFGTDEFKAIQKRRLELICQWIKGNEGDVILVSDIDIQYLRPFAAEMVDAIGDADVAFQRETDENGVNVGQMVIRCSRVALRFFEEVLKIVNETGEWEQAVINRLLPAIRSMLLPRTFANTKTGFWKDMHSFHAIGTFPRDGKTSLELKLEKFTELAEWIQSQQGQKGTLGPPGNYASSPYRNVITSSGDGEAPYTVAIVAMGPSKADYLTECTSQSGRFRVADETWAINAMAGIILHDRAIIMDALPYFAKAARTSKAHDGYRDWLHTHPGPIYTQRRYEGFPGSVEYPLEAVLNTLGYSYFNNTCSYAIALAIHMGVRHIKLYGMDFTYANNRGFAEAGRACVEFWLRDATKRGIKVTIASSSTLMDQSSGRVPYGYSNPPTIIWKDGYCRVIISKNTA